MDGSVVCCFAVDAGKPGGAARSVGGQWDTGSGSWSREHCGMWCVVWVCWGRWRSVGTRRGDGMRAARAAPGCQSACLAMRRAGSRNWTAGAAIETAMRRLRRDAWTRETACAEGQREVRNIMKRVVGEMQRLDAGRSGRVERDSRLSSSVRVPWRAGDRGRERLMGGSVGSTKVSRVNVEEYVKEGQRMYRNYE